jgi:hypothetical protein
MTARDIFGLVLRLAMLWIFIWGCWQLAASAIYLPTTLQAVVTGEHLAYGSLTYFAYGFPAVLGSILILRFAQAIIGFTYRS